MPCVILTRPLADSQLLAATLAEKGIDCILSPVMKILPLPLSLSNKAGLEGLIVTSRHALHACMPLKHLPLYAVGEHTAQTAHDLGFTVAAHAETAEMLLPHLPMEKYYLYCSGETVRIDFTRHLSHVRRIVAYRAEAVQNLTEEAINAIQTGKAEGIVFYSPRTAKIFTRLLRNHGLSKYCQSLKAYCLSEAVGERCLQLGWQHIATAAAPTQSAMITLLANMK